MSDLNDDINRYLSGKLSPSEMHELEKRALNDPFLADALEGASAVSREDLQEDLVSIQASLNKRVQGNDQKVVFWTWPLRIAAGILVLISATVVIRTLTNNERSQELALQREVTKEKAPEPPAPVVADSVIEELPQTENESVDRRKNSSVAGKPLKAPPQALAMEKEKDIAAEEAKPVQSADAPDDEVYRLEEKTADVTATTPPAPETKSETQAQSQARTESQREKKKTNERSFANVKPSETDGRIIKGRVTAADGAELPGVNVNIKGSNIGTVTDLSGHYQLKVPESDTSLVFSFIGYATAEIKPKQDEVNVRLDEDVTQLSEVVVTGYGQPKDEDDITSTVELASPQGGKRAFKQYLEKNMQYPQQALESKIEGRVTIQFAVETTGYLSEFKVIKGIGGGCDEELIRLVKSGPKWNPTKKDSNALRDIVRVRMRFQLPKK